MKKENEEIIEKIKLIDENIYQQFKKKMCKRDDYYNINEWKILGEKISQFLASQFEID